METKQNSASTKVTSRRKVAAKVNDSLEVAELKKQLLEMSEKMNELTGTKSVDKIENSMDEDDENGDVTISSDSYIKVMSLIPYQLTLTTEDYGRGKKYDFHKFGEVKRIPYHYLTEIMEQHPNFLNDGYYIILNKNVVRKHGLDDIYTRILTKENIEKIMAGNDSDAVNLFKSCSDAQRDSIIAMVHEKMIANEFVDLNLMDRFSRIIDPSGEYSISKVGEEKRAIASLKATPK
jgi:hypothetical protein